MNKQNNSALVRWLENKPVHLLSSQEAKQNLSTFQRWCKQEKSSYVPKLCSISKYFERYNKFIEAEWIAVICFMQFTVKIEEAKSGICESFIFDSVFVFQIPC